MFVFANSEQVLTDRDGEYCPAGKYMFKVTNKNTNKNPKTLIIILNIVLNVFKVRNHPFSTCAKFSENLTFLTP